MLINTNIRDNLDETSGFSHDSRSVWKLVQERPLVGLGRARCKRCEFITWPRTGRFMSPTSGSREWALTQEDPWCQLLESKLILHIVHVVSQNALAIITTYKQIGKAFLDFCPHFCPCGLYTILSSRTAIL